MAITLGTPVEHIQITTAATGHTINLSTDAVAGDYRIVHICGPAEGTTPAPDTFSVDVPAGWTEIGIGTNTSAASDQFMRVIYRKWLSGDADTLALTHTGGSIDCVTICVTVKGGDQTTFLDVAVPAFDRPLANAQWTAPAITPVTDGNFIFHAAIGDGTVAAGVVDGDIPSGDTLIGTWGSVVTTNPSNGAGMIFSYREQATAALLASVNFGTLNEEFVGATWSVRPAAAGGAFDQTSFRGVNDDGSESASTFKAAVNTNFNQLQDENFRIRFLIQEDDDLEDLDMTFQLQYNLNAGGWNNVTAGSSVVRSAASTNFADGATTTQRIGAGTFIGTNNGMDEVDGIAGGAGMDFTTTINQETEVEFCAQIRSADTTTGDTIQLRVINGKTSSPIAVYTSTPTLTIPTGAGMMLASAERLITAAAAENPGTFNFQKSLPWGAVTIALRLAGGASGAEFLPGTRYKTLVGDIQVTDTTSIDGWVITGDVQLDAVQNLSNVTITGNLNIQTAGTYNFTNVIVTGNILNNDAAGNVVINSTNSSLTTTEPGTGNDQVSIVQTVTVAVTCRDSNTGLPIEGVNVSLGTAPGLVDVMDNVVTNASGVASVSYGGTTPDDIEGFAQKGSEEPVYKRSPVSGTVTTAGFNQTVTLVPD